jgi:hypothetical protein
VEDGTTPHLHLPRYPLPLVVHLVQGVLPKRWWSLLSVQEEQGRTFWRCRGVPALWKVVGKRGRERGVVKLQRGYNG